MKAISSPITTLVIVLVISCNYYSFNNCDNNDDQHHYCYYIFCLILTMALFSCLFVYLHLTLSLYSSNVIVSFNLYIFTTSSSPPHFFLPLFPLLSHLLPYPYFSSSFYSHSFFSFCLSSTHFITLLFKLNCFFQSLHPYYFFLSTPLFFLPLFPLLSYLLPYPYFCSSFRSHSIFSLT